MRNFLIPTVCLFTATSAVAQMPPNTDSISDFEWIDQVNTGTVSGKPKDRVIYVKAQCPYGKFPVSGGFWNRANFERYQVMQSGPDRDRWLVTVHNTTGKAGSYDINVYALCAKYK